MVARCGSVGVDDEGNVCVCGGGVQVNETYNIKKHFVFTRKAVQVKWVLYLILLFLFPLGTIWNYGRRALRRRACNVIQKHNNNENIQLGSDRFCYLNFTYSVCVCVCKYHYFYRECR